MSEPKAIIDIGSNTIRLVLYAGPARAPVVVLNEKVTAKLGRGVAENGALSGKAMTVALAGLARYATLLRLKDVRDVLTVATAAARDASNGPQFLDSVRALGLDPRLLSGEEEACASAMGVIAAFPRMAGTVADLGGGSLELIDVEAGQCGRGVTIPFGSLRLAQLRAGGSAKFIRKVGKALRDAGWSGGESKPLYLVGGSHRAFARYAMRRLAWPLDDPHGFETTPVIAARLCSTAAQGKLPAQVPGISASRYASLPNTGSLLGSLIRTVKPSKLVFSSWGLREGLLYQQLDDGARAQDPLLAGVTAFAEAMGCSPQIATMVAGWTATALPAGGEGRESLRLAATMLALSSLGLEPNLRGGEAVGWALGKRWIGLSAEGRAMLAAALVANTGRLTLPPQLSLIASEAALNEALTWGLGTRLCRRFSGLSAEAIGNSALTVEGPRLTLTVNRPYASLYGDPVAKDMRLLGERLGLQPHFEVR